MSEIMRKLSSRKLWTAIASFVSMMVVAFGGTENSAAQVAAIIMAGASVIAYIVGEGLADAAGATGAQTVTAEEVKTEEITVETDKTE